MPINRGSVVNDISQPPKFAATANTTKLNKLPPGAAVSPSFVIIIMRNFSEEYFRIT